MSKMKFNVNLTNKKAEEEGVWVEYAYIPGCAFKLARFESKAVVDRHNELLRKNPKAHRGGKLYEKLLEQLFAEKVILDWRGVAVDGKAYPYSKDNAVELMHEADGDLREWFLHQSHAKENFFEKEEDVVEDLVLDTDELVEEVKK